jgi:uncharacterized CHY-type Zn-finger protein
MSSEPNDDKKRPSKEVQIHGQVIDAQTRCIHWKSKRDVVALQFYCCRKFYPCSTCHDEEVDSECGRHEVKRWPRDYWGQEAILCGSCKCLMSIWTYIGLYESDGETRCPSCSAEFNPGCRGHLGIYFEA